MKITRQVIVLHFSPALFSLDIKKEASTAFSSERIFYFLMDLNTWKCFSLSLNW